MDDETILKIPADKEIKRLPASIVWFGEDKILYSIALNIEQTMADAKRGVDELRTFIGKEKVCILSDNTNSPPTSKEIRDYAAEVIPGIAKAIAILSKSTFGRMAANLFFSLKKQPYPVKFFTSEEEAHKWLMQYR